VGSARGPGHARDWGFRMVTSSSGRKRAKRPSSRRAGLEVAMDTSARSPQEKRSIRVPGLPYYWENYFVSVIFHLLLPLFPLLIELWQLGKIGNRSIILAASMYTISIGASSRSRLMFGITVAVSLLYAFLYGISISGGSTSPGFAQTFSETGIIFVFITHALERYNRHVVERRPFWKFAID